MKMGLRSHPLLGVILWGTDSGLGEHYLTTSYLGSKIGLVIEKLLILNISLDLEPEHALVESSEGKILEIDTVSQTD